MARIYRIKVADPLTGVPWVGYHRGTRSQATAIGRKIRKKFTGLQGPPAMSVERVRKVKHESL